MNHEPASWRPNSYGEAAADLARLDIRETHFLELKRQFDRGQSGTGKLYKALASLANHGGTLVIGVEEDKEQGRATGIQRVRLQGEVERIMQVAASMDPPLALPPPRELADPHEPREGIIVVDVPASPMAPHRTPHNGYFSRDAKRAYPMPDADLERHIRLRRDRTTSVLAGLDDHIESVESLLSGSGRRTAWYAVAVDPAPAHQPFLLRSRLGPEPARDWLEPHMEYANARVRSLVEENPDLGGIIAVNWKPFYRWPPPMRIDGGVRFASHSASEDPPKVGVIEILETGAVRLSENYLNMSGSTTLHWQDLPAAVTWALGLFVSMQQEAGTTVGASVALHIGGIAGATPAGNFGDHEEQRRRQMLGWNPDPYPGKFYRATRSLNGVELEGDLRDALDWLLGQWLRNLSLPDILYRSGVTSP